MQASLSQAQAAIQQLQSLRETVNRLESDIREAKAALHVSEVSRSRYLA